MSKSGQTTHYPFLKVASLGHVPLRRGDTLNRRRAASPLVRLVEGEERLLTEHIYKIIPIETRRPSGRIVEYRVSTPQVWGLSPELRKVNSAFYPFSGWINEHQACARELNTGVSRQTDRLAGKSAHAPLCPRTATAGSDVVQSGRPIFDDFFQHLWPYIGNNTVDVVFQMVKRLWLIRIDQ
ncbi:hypothetical protein TNCV_3796771 [Trichonephila clavipes]|nr:hypothetical protein TNCV_3796771 [Trichonephila clavipes]